MDDTHMRESFQIGSHNPETEMKLFADSWHSIGCDEDTGSCRSESCALFYVYVWVWKPALLLKKLFSAVILDLLKGSDGCIYPILRISSCQSQRNLLIDVPDWRAWALHNRSCSRLSSLSQFYYFSRIAARFLLFHYVSCKSKTSLKKIPRDWEKILEPSRSFSICHSANPSSYNPNPCGL